MQKNRTTIGKKWLAALFFTSTIIAYSSCSKRGKGSNTAVHEHTMKFIVTATISASFKDVINVSFDGAAVSDSCGTLRSVVGATQANQSGFVGNADAFPPAKTTTLSMQSVMPISKAGMGISFQNALNIPGCMLSYQAIVDR